MAVSSGCVSVLEPQRRRRCILSAGGGGGLLLQTNGGAPPLQPVLHRPVQDSGGAGGSDQKHADELLKGARDGGHLWL